MQPYPEQLGQGRKVLLRRPPKNLASLPYQFGVGLPLCDFALRLLVAYYVQYILNILDILLSYEAIYI
jgi:hypothetical protein